jgi:hypothetical protein
MALHGKGIEAAPLPSWVPPGWYPDPLGVGAARYWDGSQWSKRHRDAPPPDPLPSHEEVHAAEQQWEAAKAESDPAEAEADAAKRAQAAAVREREAQGGVVVAKFSPGFTSIRVYEDGTIESKMHGSGSIIGATARVDQSGSKRVFRDTRQAYLTIEGPQVSISAKLGSASGLAVGAARKFAAQVNSLAQRLTPAVPTSGSIQTETQTSVPDQIAKLAELRDKDILTEEEFEAKKAELLRRI